MDDTVFAHTFPWTEDQYIALGETSDRVELLDGGLLVTPFDHTAPHQRLVMNLVEALWENAGDLVVLSRINLRLRPGRIVNPDIVVLDPGVDLHDIVVDAAMVRLVGEVTASTSSMLDRVLKTCCYAEAGTPFYLIADPDPDPSVQLYRLVGGEYVLDGEGSPGMALRIAEPVEANLGPANRSVNGR